VVFPQPCTIKQKAYLIHLQALALAISLHKPLKCRLPLDLEVDNIAILFSHPQVSFPPSSRCWLWSEGFKRRERRKETICFHALGIENRVGGGKITLRDTTAKLGKLWTNANTKSPTLWACCALSYVCDYLAFDLQIDVL
jgi:hypothetical protein